MSVVGDIILIETEIKNVSRRILSNEVRPITRVVLKRVTGNADIIQSGIVASVESKSIVAIIDDRVVGVLEILNPSSLFH